MEPRSAFLPFFRFELKFSLFESCQFLLDSLHVGDVLFHCHHSCERINRMVSLWDTKLDRERVAVRVLQSHPTNGTLARARALTHVGIRQRSKDKGNYHEARKTHRAFGGVAGR